MAQQTINVGAAPNDGTGTPLRTAFQYTNSNFSELYTAVGPSGNNIVVPGNATITGDLTVDTSTLKVDSANDRVIVGHTSGSSAFQVTNAGAAGLEIQPTGFSSAPLILSYNRSSSAYTQLTLDGSTIVHALNGSTAMTLNSNGLLIGTTVAPAYSSKLRVEGGVEIHASQALNVQPGNTNPYEIVNRSAGGFAFYPTGSALGMTLDASGILMVGTTNTVVWNTTNEGCVVSPIAIQASRSGDSALLLNRIASDGKIAVFARQGIEVGNIAVTTLATTYNSISDYRLKEDAQPLSGGLARVNALKPSVYKWKANGSAGEGFLAHELAEVVPAAVTGEKDDVNEDGSIKAQSIDMSRVVPILVAAIQELTARVQTLETR